MDTSENETRACGILVHRDLHKRGVFCQCWATYKERAWGNIRIRYTVVQDLESANPRDLATWNDHGARKLIMMVLSEKYDKPTAESFLVSLEQRLEKLGFPIY